MSEDELPEGWAAANLGDLLEPGGLFDGPFGSNLKTSDYTSTGVRVVRLENLASLRFIEGKRTFISREKYRTLKNHTVVAGDLLFGSFLDGAVRVTTLPTLDTPAIAKADCFCIRPRSDVVLPRYLMYFLGANQTKNALIEQVHGATRPRVTTRQLRELEISIAPFPEQKRIVAKIEALLGRVDAARERLARVPFVLKRFRQAVLAASCDGGLTEAWRRVSGSSAPWRSVALPEVAESRLGKMLDKARNVGKQKPYLRNINVRWFGFNLSDVQNLRATDREIEELGVKPGDVLVCEGGEPGRCAVWRGRAGQVVYQKALHRVRVGESLLPAYLCYTIKNAADAGALEDLFTGSTIKHLTGVSLAQFEFELPPVEEQQEIVRRVEALFKLANAIEKRVTTATARAGRLAQSILAKAFRGELVPTEAELARREGRSYEPAAALLERMSLGREHQGKASKRTLVDKGHA